MDNLHPNAISESEEGSIVGLLPDKVRCKGHKTRFKNPDRGMGCGVWGQGDNE